MKRISVCFIILLVWVTAAACSGGAAQPEPETATMVTVLPLTNTPAPTDTAVPTNTAVPTDTPPPTDTPTPKPTNTAVPTKPPAPTATPLPEPVVYTGSGDALVDVKKTDAPMLIRIEGNSAGRYFGVTAYDADNEMIDILVNTTDPYIGVRPLDFLTGEYTKRLEVQAAGDWTITIYPVLMADDLEVPGLFQGVGDNVIILSGDTPDTAVISGNAGDHYFGVIGYGSGIDILVNTTDPYDGTVLLDRETFLLEVQATGDWTVKVSGR